MYVIPKTIAFSCFSLTLLCVVVFAIYLINLIHFTALAQILRPLIALTTTTMKPTKMEIVLVSIYIVQ